MNVKKFTLIELIVSIVVIAIILAIVLVQFQNFKEKSIATYLSANTKEFQTAVDLYYLENKEYPTLNDLEITLENPQYINIPKLVEEGYLKKELNLDKITTQHYKIDVFGRVWGSSQPSLENNTLITSEDGAEKEFTVEVSKEINKLVVYEVVNGKSVTAAEYELNSYFANSKKSLNEKVSFKKIGDFNNSGNTKVKIKISSTNSVYLVSGIDKYETETAPVGAGYDSELFGPIRGGSGTYEYILEGFKLKTWVDYMTIQDTPNGSSIEYEFSVKEKRNGSYGEWTTDFHSLPKGYGIKVRIKMTTGTGGSKASLYSLKIIYNEEPTSSKKPNVMNSISTESSIGSNYLEGEMNISGKIGSAVGEGTVSGSTCPAGDLKLGDIGNEYVFGYFHKLESKNAIEGLSISQDGVNKIEIRYAQNGTFFPVSSYLDIPEESCVYVYVYTPKDVSGKVVIPSSPIIYETPVSEFKNKWVVISIDNEGKPIEDSTLGTSPDNKVYGGIPKTPNPNDTYLKDDNWVTIDDVKLIQQGRSEYTTWINYRTGETVEQDKTRLLYRFAVGNGYFWSGELLEFPYNEVSNSLMVHVYFQVHKDHVNNPNIEDPKLDWIKVISSDGDYDLDADRPQMLIYPIKNNNTNRSTISTESLVDWKYQAVDPNGIKIVDVEWSTTELTKVKYAEGEYSIRGRVLNEEGIWSNWANYSFTVKPEKPIADFNVSPNRDYFYAGEKITFDTSLSKDPDGDLIVDYEWINKKESYSLGEIGNVTISLRVKDSEGNWSEWRNKTISILDAETDFWLVNGIPASKAGYQEIFDKNVNTTKTTEQDMLITWDKEIAGETVYIKLNRLNTNYWSKFEFVNENNAPVRFISKNYGLMSSIDFATSGSFISGIYEDYIIVPTDAKAIRFTTERGNVSNLFHSIEIISYTERPNAISNISNTPANYSDKGSFDKPSNVVRTYFLSEDGNQLYTSTTSNNYSIEGLQPEKTIKYKIISVDSNFISSIPIFYEIQTLKGDVIWYVNGLEASLVGYQNIFDKNANSSVLVNRDVSFTANENLVGKKLYIKITRYNYNYWSHVYFSDKNGNAIPFRSIYYYNGYVNGIDFGDRGARSGYEDHVIVPEGTVSINYISQDGNTAIEINSIEIIE